MNCSICLEEINTNKNNTVTKCGHKFCSSCIFSHLKISNLCPLCREPLTEPNKKEKLSETTQYNIVEMASHNYNFQRPAARIYNEIMVNTQTEENRKEIIAQFADQCFVLGAHTACDEVNNYIEHGFEYFDDIPETPLPPPDQSVVRAIIPLHNLFLPPRMPPTMPPTNENLVRNVTPPDISLQEHDEENNNAENNNNAPPPPPETPEEIFYRQTYSETPNTTYFINNIQ